MNRINPVTTKLMYDVFVFAASYGGGALFVAFIVGGAVVSWRNWKRNGDG